MFKSWVFDDFGSMINISEMSDECFKQFEMYWEECQVGLEY